MLRPYRSVILGLLVSALAACSQPVSSPPPPPANASAEETSQTLQTLAQEIQQAIQEIENALRAFFPQQLAGQNLLPGQANLPKALENLTALRWENLLSVRPWASTPWPPRPPCSAGSLCAQVGTVSS